MGNLGATSGEEKLTRKFPLEMSLGLLAVQLIEYPAVAEGVGVDPVSGKIPRA